MAGLRIVVPVVLLLAAACSSTTTTRREASLPGAKTLTIAMTANRSLELEPCGCSIAPLGGLEREWNAMEKVKASGSQALLNFSSGPTFVPPGKTFDPKKREYYTRKAAFLLEALNTLGLSALSLSADDFNLGADQIRTLEKKAQFPFISTNLYSKSTGKPLFERYREYTVGDMTVLVLGVSHKPTGEYHATADDVEVRPAAEAVAAVIAELPPKPRFVVLLSSLTPEDMDQLRRKVPQVRLALGGTETHIQNDIQQLAPGFVYYTPLDRARNVSQIGIEVRKEISTLTNDQALNDIRSSRKNWTKSIADAQKGLKKKRLSAFEKKNLNATMETAKQRLKDTEWVSNLAKDATPYTFTQYVLDKDLDGEENKMTDLVKRFKEAVRDLAMSETDEEKEE